MGLPHIHFRADVSPRHFAEAEDETVPDHLWELVLMDGDKTECLVETDELQGRVHVQHLMPAGVDQCLYDEPGEATPPEFFQGEDPINFVSIRMKPGTWRCGQCPFDKGAENAVFCKIGLLLVIVVPDIFYQGEFE